MLNDSNSKPMEISFVLQVTNLLNLQEIDENYLFKLLRSEKLNDRIKAMVMKLLDLKEEDDVIRMLRNEYKHSALICASLIEKFKDFKHLNKNVKSSSKLINLINGNYKSFSETEQAILEDRSDNTDGYKYGYEQYISFFSSPEQVIIDPNALRYLLKRDKITLKEFMKQIGKLKSIDFELIAMKTFDPELFWNSLNKINFMILSEDNFEVKPSYILECMMDKDIKSYSLPAQLYFFKLLNEGDEFYDSCAVDLYEKYKNNFDETAEIFQEFIKSRHK